MHHYSIFDSNNYLIWKGEKNNQIENYDEGLDTLLLIQFKLQFKSFPIPDNLLYVDYLLDSYETELNCFLYEHNDCCYKKLFDSYTIFENKKDTALTYKIDEINNFMEEHYQQLFKFSISLTSELNTKNALEYLYPMANNNSYYSKAAQFIIKQINGVALDKMEIINYYGGIQNAVDAIGNLIMDTKLKQN